MNTLESVAFTTDLMPLVMICPEAGGPMSIVTIDSATPRFRGEPSMITDMDSAKATSAHFVATAETLTGADGIALERDEAA